MKPEADNTSPRTLSAPAQRLFDELGASTSALLTDLAEAGDGNEWKTVDELFYTLFPLLEAIYQVRYQPPGPPGKQGGPPPPEDPPGGWRFVSDRWRAGKDDDAKQEGTPPPMDPPDGTTNPPTDRILHLAGIREAVQEAEARALAEMARLAGQGLWQPLFRALPAVEKLDIARRVTDPP